MSAERALRTQPERTSEAVYYGPPPPALSRRKVSTG
ncbi:hypothetical protein MHPYR_140056 [uncultured Mycobacterium sp.]|uniref:Uncharacterized protein n=1 Tax=uncultured Mycobacterium sp. TaxID=171292 RepID=A0A1Y5P1J9_9MYCO|nr:hypothetical protein MHPYR_140056 [uncultured Mycobacterium sp.]